MLADKVRDLGFNGLSQQNTRPIAQDFGELVADVSWLNQFDDVIFGHGISLLQWRSGGVKHPHDMPPFRFLPSPTFGDSSLTTLATPQVQRRAAVLLPSGGGGNRDLAYRGCATISAGQTCPGSSGRGKQGRQPRTYAARPE